MKWQDIAGGVADIGLPILATAFGIPGPVATFAAGLVKKALGLPASATPGDVQSTIAGMDPEVAKATLEGAQTEVQAKYAYLTAIVEAQARVNERNVAEINKTMREELGRVSWFHWRNLLGYVVGAEILIFPFASIGAILFGTPEQANALISFQGSLVAILTIASALLGAVAMDTTNRYNTAMTGERSSSVVGSIVGAVARKK